MVFQASPVVLHVQTPLLEKGDQDQIHASKLSLFWHGMFLILLLCCRTKWIAFKPDRSNCHYWAGNTLQSRCIPKERNQPENMRQTRNRHENLRHLSTLQKFPRLSDRSIFAHQKQFPAKLSKFDRNSRRLLHAFAFEVIAYKWFHWLNAHTYIIYLLYRHFENISSFIYQFSPSIFDIDGIER